MSVLYFLVGTMLATLGGAFPGASNIAVVSSVVGGNPKQGKQIAYGAGLGEITLAFLALYYSMMVSDFFEMNPWVKVTFVAVFFAVGSLFLFKHKLPNKQKRKANNFGPWQRLFKGFALAAFNPPVLLFWLVAIALVHNNYFELSAMLALPKLMLFFGGVFLGKVAILLIYGSTGKRLTNGKQKTAGNKGMNTVIGLALIAIATIQSLRLWVI